MAYPYTRTKGSNFQAAAFSVNELKEAKSEAECVSLKEPPPPVGKPHREIVKGVKFVVTETDGVAAGNLIEGYLSQLSLFARVTAGVGIANTTRTASCATHARISIAAGVLMALANVP